ncbi:hypothetical protein HZH68_015011 [Vespula germanica]|uniref:Uncharacterized protein n=1 Tax=Vespula germanica TaxID=30212 RepID=A0A834MRY4_VESGE|nr:hypothetical protein HZH68_015011 [Vespula germanica]
MKSEIPQIDASGQIKRSIMSKKLRSSTYTSDTSKPIIYSIEKVVFVDLQGFKIQNNLFVLKEFAICDMTDNLVANYVFLPPFHEDQLSRKDEIGVRWLTDNHHGLEWNDGFVNYNLRYEIFEQHLICSSSILNIYMKGTEKIQWLYEFLSEKHSRLLLEKRIKILNIEDEIQYLISTELDNNEYSKCFLHRNKKFCALKIVQILKRN